MVKPSPEELKAIFQIVSQTKHQTGVGFFGALVKEMAEVLQVSHSFVSVYEGDFSDLKILAYWNGTELLTDFQYRLESPPNLAVVGKDYIHYSKAIQEIYPDDKFFKEIGAESFRGVPLVSRTGIQFGYLAVIDQKAIDDEPRFVTLMQTFAARAVAEFERVQAERLQQKSEQRLACILDSAMDAILVLRHDGEIKIFNKAARRIFAVENREVLGESIFQFFTKAFTKELKSCLSKAAAELERSEAIWLPDGLKALRANGTEFAVEATISQLTFDHEVLLTIILRDITEKIQAQRLIEQLCEEKESLKAQNHGSGDFFVGRSKSMNEVNQLVNLVAPTDSSVLILGETGTGKELVARAIHQRSPRNDKPLIIVNCAALPETLIETELFGHEKGAFTGATSARKGRFERANHGTIFLDEIGELPMKLQAKLLRVLQEGEFERLGGSQRHKTDVRVIAATNRDLEMMVSANEFREDLYYRLNVIPIKLPPLRKRWEDLADLVQYLERRISNRLGRRSKQLTENGVSLLKNYHWPGNVRELQNIVERAVLLSQGLELDLSLAMRFGPATSNDASLGLQDQEKRHIEKVLSLTNGRINGSGGAAELLEINPSTLRSRMKKLGIQS